MRLTLRALAASALTLSALALPAAAQEAVVIPPTIPEVVLPSPDLQNYVPVLRDPALARRLTGPGPITAFIPQDRPVQRLPGAPSWPTAPDEAARTARAMVTDGLWTHGALRQGIADGNDRLVLETDSGASLLVVPTGRGTLVVVDKWGNTAEIVGPLRPSLNGGVLVLDAPLDMD
jgi:hypothetical protein